MIDQDYINKLQQTITELETQMSTPEVATNAGRMRDLMMERSRKIKVFDAASRFLALQTTRREAEEMLTENDEEMRAMVQEELEAAEVALPEAEKALKIALLPPDEREGRNVIVEIRAGTGGEEAGLFAGDLRRMYSRFAEKHDWKVEWLDLNPSELGGYKGNHFFGRRS